MPSLSLTDSAVNIKSEGAPELPCESGHNYVKCSGNPTHVLNSCYLPHPRRVCEATFFDTSSKMNDERVLCFGCNRLAGDCWTLAPID